MPVPTICDTAENYLLCFNKGIDQKRIFFVVLCMRHLPVFVKFHELAKEKYKPTEFSIQKNGW